MNEDKNFITDKIQNYAESFKKHFTIILISIIIGMSIGIYFCKVFYVWRIDEATKLGGFIHKNTIYDLRLRP